MRFAYPARFHRYGDDEVVVSFRDLPECLTSGEDEDEALLEARDALEEAVAGRIRRNEDLPSPSLREADEQYVAVPVDMAAKAALVLAFRASALTCSTLADRLGIDEKSVRKMLDPCYATSASRIDEALSSLDRELVVEIHELSRRNESKVEFTVDPKTKSIYKYLIQVAECRSTVYYVPTAERFGFDLDCEEDRYRFYGILDEINKAEHNEERPLLSSVVVGNTRKDPQIPGPGFFGLARKLGKYMGSDDTQYWKQEVQCAYDFWSQQRSGPQ